MKEEKITAENGEKNNFEKLSNKERFIQLVKFVLFSISAGLVQIISYTILNLCIPSDNLYWIKYGISLVLSVLWNFTLNREFTFKSANNVPIAMIKVACFYVVFTPLSMWGGQALVDLGWNGFLVEVLTMLCNFVLEYLYDTFFVFRNSMNTKKSALKKDEETTEEQGITDNK